MKILLICVAVILFMVFWGPISIFLGIGSRIKKREPEHDPERVNSTGEALAAFMQNMNRAREEYKPDATSSEYAIAGMGGPGSGMRIAASLLVDRTKIPVVPVMPVHHIRKEKEVVTPLSLLLKLNKVKPVTRSLMSGTSTKFYSIKKENWVPCTIVRLLKNGSFLVEDATGAIIRKKSRNIA